MNKIAMTGCLLLMMSSAAHAGNSGFWVVLGSYSQEYQDEAVDNSVRVVRAANRCGYKPSVGTSDRMIGMRSGFFIQVVGPFGSRDEAEMIRNDVRRCVKDAYVKQGTYVPANKLQYRGLED